MLKGQSFNIWKFVKFVFFPCAAPVQYLQSPRYSLCCIHHSSVLGQDASFVREALCNRMAARPYNDDDQYGFLARHNELHDIGTIYVGDENPSGPRSRSRSPCPLPILRPQVEDSPERVPRVPRAPAVAICTAAMRAAAQTNLQVARQIPYYGPFAESYAMAAPLGLHQYVGAGSELMSVEQRMTLRNSRGITLQLAPPGSLNLDLYPYCTNLINTLYISRRRAFYIGISKQPEVRLQQHRAKRSMNSMRVVACFADEQGSSRLEAQLIHTFVDHELCLNLKTGRDKVVVLVWGIREFVFEASETGEVWRIRIYDALSLSLCSCALL